MTTKALIIGMAIMGLGALSWAAASPATESLYLGGLKKFINREYDGAVRDFGRAYELEPDNAVNRRMYGRALTARADRDFRAGRLQAAAEDYARVLSIDPAESHARYRLDAIRDISRHLADERARETARARRAAVLGVALAGLCCLAAAGVYTARRRRGGPVNEQAAMPVWDESQYLPEAAGTGLVRAARLLELNQQLRNGALSWNELAGYIDELNGEVKERILDLVGNCLQGGAAVDRALAFAVPLADDPDEQVSGRSRALLAELNALAGQDYLDERFLLLLARMVDARTGRDRHANRVAETAFRIAVELDDPAVPALLTRKAGLLHDVGYLQIRGHITSEEEAGPETLDRYWDVVRTHPLKGANLVQFTDLPPVVIEALKYHHERLDGSGYPLGLRGGDIPPMALVLSAAECLDDWCAAVAAGRGAGATLTEDAAQIWFGDDIARILTGLAREHAGAWVRDRRSTAAAATAAGGRPAPIYHARNAC